METQSPAPAAAPEKKRNWVPIAIVVGVLVLVLVALGAWRLRSDDSSDPGRPAGQSAKGLFNAWQDGDETAANRFASPDSVTVLFAVPASDADGMEFGGCTATGDDPWPKECIWSRPGGELTMTVQQGDDLPQVTKVTYGPAGLPPDDSSSDSSG
jgi:hypothetical protein